MTRNRIAGMVRTAFCVAVLATAVSGCTGHTPAGGGTGPNGGAAPNGGSSPNGGGTGQGGGTVSAATVWRDFVTCAREHGQQNMPDPVVNADGRATFPATDGFDEKHAYDAVRADCGPILDRLPPNANPTAVRPLTPEQMQVVRNYVQCMRDNGVPDIPDPGPNGEIVDPPQYADGPLRAARDTARGVCDHILLDGFR